MKMVRAAMVVLALFTLACAGNRVKYRLLDSGDPTSGQDSGGEDSEGDADTDADADADAPYTRWDGVERFEHGSSTTPGDRECEVIWNVTGTPTAIECLDCLFAFDVSLVYDAASSAGAENCANQAGDTAYAYGYVEDYGGYGPALMYYGTYGWSAFFAAELDSSDDTLKYVGGVIDYSYSGPYTGYATYYITSYYTGEAQLTR